MFPGKSFNFTFSKSSRISAFMGFCELFAEAPGYPLSPFPFADSAACSLNLKKQTNPA